MFWDSRKEICQRFGVWLLLPIPGLSQVPIRSRPVPAQINTTLLKLGKFLLTYPLGYRRPVRPSAARISRF
jgi:hypothetical protein